MYADWLPTNYRPTLSSITDRRCRCLQGVAVAACAAPSLSQSSRRRCCWLHSAVCVTVLIAPSPLSSQHRRCCLHSIGAAVFTALRCRRR
eukprot:2145181-Pleurochrysis_carterae.AAC.1